MMKKLLEDTLQALKEAEYYYGLEFGDLRQRVVDQLVILREAEAPERNCNTCLRGDTLEGFGFCYGCPESDYDNWEPKLTPEEHG